jgi:hypothetical protein
VAHLVLGQPRPKAKASGRRSKRKTPPAVLLAPDVEAALRLREEYGHKRGTPETYGHLAVELRREGSLARLVRSGALDQHQLAAAEEIREAHAAVIADVAVRTARWERGLGGGTRTSAAGESWAAVLRQVAYTEWREAVAPHAAMLLTIIIDDLALTLAARRWRMSDRRARRLLGDALDRWRRR